MTNEETRPSAERAGSESATSAKRGNAIIPPDTAEPDGLDQAIENSKSDWWTAGALLAIRQLALTNRGFTVDNLRDMVGEPEDFHYWGAVFAVAQRQGVIEPVGARVGRAGLVRVWWGLPA